MNACGNKSSLSNVREKDGCGTKNSRIPDDTRKEFLRAVRTEISSQVLGISRGSAELKIGGNQNARQYQDRKIYYG